MCLNLQKLEMDLSLYDRFGWAMIDMRSDRSNFNMSDLIICQWKSIKELVVFMSSLEV